MKSLTQAESDAAALKAMAHANHVLTDAIGKVVRGERTVDQLKAWWHGPLVKQEMTDGPR